MSQSPSKPLVSISVITYNHSAYISQTLDGILMQKTDFDYEVIIGDDVSTDHTRDILLEYQNKYPDRINLILHETKHGGIPGKMNFVSTIHAAQGKYVALLDGDDYWTDEFKLQRQVDFLNQNQEYSMVFHNSMLKFEGLPGQDRTYNPWTTQQTFSLEELIRGNWFIHSGSIMYRRELFPRVKDTFYALPSGDIPICVTLADQGKVGYLPEVMSVYRKNPGSVSYQGDHIGLKSTKSRILIFETLDQDLEGRHHQTFAKAIQGQQLQMAKFALRAGDIPLLQQQIGILRSEERFFNPQQNRLFRILSFFSRLPVFQPLVPLLIRLRRSLAS